MISTVYKQKFPPGQKFPNDFAEAYKISPSIYHPGQKFPNDFAGAYKISPSIYHPGQKFPIIIVTPRFSWTSLPYCYQPPIKCIVWCNLFPG